MFGLAIICVIHFEQYCLWKCLHDVNLYGIYEQKCVSCSNRNISHCIIWVTSVRHCALHFCNGPLTNLLHKPPICVASTTCCKTYKKKACPTTWPVSYLFLLYQHIYHSTVNKITCVYHMIIKNTKRIYNLIQ